MEEESAAIAHALDEVKEEVHKRHDAIKQHVDLMENKVKNIEEKFVDFALRTKCNPEILLAKTK